MYLRRTALRIVILAAVATAFVSDADGADVKRGEHPLDRAIAMASSSLDNVKKNVKGYRCKFVKAERIGSKVSKYSHMEMRVRHEPFSVFLKFVDPDEHAGRQAIFVRGKNNDKLVVKERFLPKFAAVKIDPAGRLATEGQRYPITEAGIKNLTERLLEVARHDRRQAETEVKYYYNAKVGGRECNVIEVIHPKQRDTFLFHKAQVFVDRELNVPLRYAAYGWPPEPGAEAPLEEEYTYLDFKIDNDLTDADFELE